MSSEGSRMTCNEGGSRLVTRTPPMVLSCQLLPNDESSDLLCDAILNDQRAKAKSHMNVPIRVLLNSRPQVHGNILRLISTEPIRIAVFWERGLVEMCQSTWLLPGYNHRCRQLATYRILFS